MDGPLRGNSGPVRHENEKRRRLMSKTKLLLGLLTAAILCTFAPLSQAQSIPIVAVGSSALFPSAAIAAVKGDPVRSSGPICGSHFWTGTASAIDARKSLTS